MGGTSQQSWITQGAVFGQPPPAESAFGSWERHNGYLCVYVCLKMDIPWYTIYRYSPWYTMTILEGKWHDQLTNHWKKGGAKNFKTNIAKKVPKKMVDIHTQSLKVVISFRTQTPFRNLPHRAEDPQALEPWQKQSFGQAHWIGCRVSLWWVFYVRSANRVIIIHLLLQIPSGQELEAMFTGCQTLSKSVPTTLFASSLCHSHILESCYISIATAAIVWLQLWKEFGAGVRGDSSESEMNWALISCHCFSLSEQKPDLTKPTAQ